VAGGDARKTGTSGEGDRSSSCRGIVRGSGGFGAGFEPLLGTSPGLLRVKNGCAPVFLSNGMPGTSIEQNTPNPFSTSTRITYYVGKSDGPLTAVRLSLYDPLGKEVRRLCETDESPGAHVVILDASSLTAGVYTYRFDCGKRHEVRSLVVTK